MWNKLKSKKSILGFSMVELVVATGISSIVALGSGAIMVQAIRTDMHGQAMADAARAGDILKRTVFARTDGDACTNNMSLVSGFNAGDFGGDGVDIQVQNVNSFGGVVRAGQETPYGDIVDFKVVGADGIADFQDIDGNEVHSGTAYIVIRKDANYPPTPVYLGTIGLRIDPTDNSYQGCITTDEEGLEMGESATCDNSAFRCAEGPSPATDVGAGPAVPEGNDRAPGFAANCAVGQTRVWRDPNLFDSDLTNDEYAPTSEAQGACRTLIEFRHCGCENSTDGDCTDPGDRMRAMTGIGGDGSVYCEVIPDPDNPETERRSATPEPQAIIIPTTRPGYTPTPVLNTPTPHPSDAPTPSPTPASPNPPNQSCGDTRATLGCIEICVGFNWNAYGGTCPTYCPPSTGVCPTVAYAPTSAPVIPTPVPFVPPPTPVPVNDQCTCGGQIISEGSFCGACIYSFEPELSMYGQNYSYIERRQSLRCINGSLVSVGTNLNPNTGACGGGTTTGFGDAIYEYW